MSELVQTNLVLGIDAGNTKTIALIADAAGQVLGWGRSGSSNIYVRPARALAALKTAVERARNSAGLTNAPLSALTLSAAGADWPEDFEELNARLQVWNWAARSAVVNDAVGALRAGSLHGTGVTVVCGTSAGIAARTAGEVWHSSYWQEPEGADELATKALRAVYRADLGIDPPTALTAPVLAHFGCPDVEALLHSFTRRGRSPSSRLGKLARVLLDGAEGGDAVSLDIVQKHGASLGDYALAAARKVGLDGEYLLTTSGGVMRHKSPILREALLSRVREHHPHVRWQASHHEPVFGALLLALETAGVTVDEAVFRRLEQTCPDEALFST
ncbi:N-acetylglucosamine kinase [Deinococcus arenicola]|uniref:ATPase BadF/BadG/BcrA/BcrD type domain-containing protein n=1 Tax=Deinococcus arenicola TaxID=2994950 RepID=A0ABU4DU01_9DEIO|nr:BadF/BadG/BcrA/BcrD ATPase family protein [Deinococcus sp. ZS9-10]MDV6375457.1 hypothetical protein [Deinococcus sp. ZS9-10]